MDHRELVQAGYRFALSLCHHPDEARDLVQEGWARMWSHYDTSNKNILFRCVRNLWIDKVRRPKLVVIDSGRAEAKAESDARGLGTLPERDELEAALGALNPAEREAIFLSAVEGYTAEEISYFTQQSRNTVLSQLRRGKEKLRSRLADLSESSDAPDRESTPREVLP